jgi:hypothetical protein
MLVFLQCTRHLPETTNEMATAKSSKLWKEKDHFFEEEKRLTD